MLDNTDTNTYDFKEINLDTSNITSISRINKSDKLYDSFVIYNNNILCYNKNTLAHNQMYLDFITMDNTNTTLSYLVDFSNVTRIKVST